MHNGIYISALHSHLWCTKSR